MHNGFNVKVYRLGLLIIPMGEKKAILTYQASVSVLTSMLLIHRKKFHNDKLHNIMGKVHVQFSKE